MSVDAKVYALAQTWLANEGWTHTEDVATLAQRIQDTIEDFMAELPEVEHDGQL